MSNEEWPPKIKIGDIVAAPGGAPGIELMIEIEDGYTDENGIFVITDAKPLYLNYSQVPDTER